MSDRNSTMSQPVDLQSPDDIALADRMNAGRQQIVSELKKLIIGQDEVIGQVLMTLFVGGNSLIVGVPGLAKTLLIRTLAQVLDLKFNRIQFTPDLMPSDITGTDIIQEDATTGRRQMVFAPGPIFANIVLADEIIRTPPGEVTEGSRVCQSFKRTPTIWEVKLPNKLRAVELVLKLQGLLSDNVRHEAGDTLQDFLVNLRAGNLE